MHRPGSLDPTGKASVEYFRASGVEEDEQQLTKRKLSYAAVAAGGTGVPIDVRPEVDSDTTGALSRPLAWLRDASFDESLVIPIASLGLTTRVTSSESLHLVEHGWRAAGTMPDVDWTAPWSSVSGAEDVAAISTEGDALVRARLEGMSLEGLLAEIDLLANAEPCDTPKLMDARHDLAELLRTRPEAVAALAERVGSMNAATADVALGAAGAAGTEPAQRLLADVLKDPTRPDTLRQSSLDSMFQLTRPTTESYDAVDGVVSDGSQSAGLRANGMLVLGALASMDPGSEVDRSARVARLVALEGDARADGRLEHWLHALGNTGDAQAFPAARPYLESGDARLRHAAVEAVRGVEGPDVTGALAQRALSDSDARVRRTCAGILAERTDDVARNAVRRLLEHERAVDVRRAAVDALARRAATDEGARALLAHVAVNDPSEELRQRAASVR